MRKKRLIDSEKGFTGLEIFIVVALLGLTSTATTPYFNQVRESGRKSVCSAERHAFESADSQYMLEKSRSASTFNDLFSAGYVKKSASCPSKGDWLRNATREKINCSYHDGTPVNTSNGPLVLDPLSGDLQGRWFKLGSSIATNWSGQKVSFKVNIEKKGAYEIWLTAKNRAGHPGWTKVDGYKNFHIKVTIDGRRQESIFVPVSDTEFQSDESYISSLSKGEHTLTFEWVNDAYKPNKRQDNNIEIKEIRIVSKN